MADVNTDYRDGSRVESIAVEPVFGGNRVAHAPDRAWAMVAKRAIDMCAASCALLVCSPFMLLVAIVIKSESPGSVLFRQVRVGKDRSQFTFYKFRTMIDGNDPAIHVEYVTKLITHGCDDLKGDTGSFKIEDDPRVTRVGHFLRRWSIDELPQLFNVFKGEMSLVGPRPPLPYEVELYSGEALRRLECQPGITGLWQVSGRCQTTFDEMVALDVEYIERWSLGLDFWILARTIPVVLRRKGAW